MTVRSAHGGRLALVGTGLALCYTVQQSAMPVLLPLAVRLGLDEIRMGVVITASGCAFLLSNPLWTFLSHRRGTRPLLLGGLIGVLLSALAFAAVVRWPPQTAQAAFALALLTRGMLFGLALAAVAVSSAAFLLADAEQRGRAATVIAAAPGIGIVAGPLLDTATGSRGLLVLLLAPLVLLAVTTSFLVRLPPGVRQGPAERVTWQWGPFLRSGWPHLLVVVSLLLLVAATQVNIGFLLRDRIGAPADEAGHAAAWVLVAGGAAFLLTQAVAAARPALLGTWSLRAGLLMTLLGVLPLAFGPSLSWIMLGAVVTAVGVGFALPACYERVSRTAGEAGQTQAGGAISAASGVAFAIGPVVATGLHTVGSATPFLFVAGLLLTGFACSLATRS